MEPDSNVEELGVNSSSKDDNNDRSNQVQVNQDFFGKDGTVWQALATLHVGYNVGACNNKTY